MVECLPPKSAMPGVSIFIDSTTFLYTIDLDGGDKRRIARDWLIALTEHDVGLTNLQVLNEVTSVLLRKAHRFDRGDPFEQVDIFADFGTAPIDLDTAARARELRGRHRYSWWDCLLLASALERGCTHFLSEDLHDGHVVEGLTIVDPFAHTPDQIFS